MSRKHNRPNSEPVVQDSTLGDQNTEPEIGDVVDDVQNTESAIQGGEADVENTEARAQAITDERAKRKAEALAFLATLQADELTENDVKVLAAVVPNIDKEAKRLHAEQLAKIAKDAVGRQVVIDFFMGSNEDGTLLVEPIPAEIKRMTVELKNNVFSIVSASCGGERAAKSDSIQTVLREQGYTHIACVYNGQHSAWYDLTDRSCMWNAMYSLGVPKKDKTESGEKDNRPSSEYANTHKATWYVLHTDATIHATVYKHEKNAEGKNVRTLKPMAESVATLPGQLVAQKQAA